MRGKILIADDEPGIVAFIRRNFENEGYEILVAARGDDVLRLVDEQPDLIVRPAWRTHLGVQVAYRPGGGNC